MTYAQEDWYHIAQTPEGVHVHKMDHKSLTDLAKQLLERGLCGGTEDPQSEAITMAVGMYAEAIRRALEFPQEWLRAGDYNSSLAPGEPHATLMAIATIHEDLPEVG